MNPNKHFYRIDDYSELSLYGKNKRSISLIVLEQDYNLHKELLEKIMGSVQLDMEEDLSLCVISDKNKRVQLKDHEILAKSKHLFLFGIESKTLSCQFEFHNYRPIITEEFIIHPLDLLQDLSSDINKKKILWSYLKKIFK